MHCNGWSRESHGGWRSHTVHISAPPRNMWVQSSLGRCSFGQSKNEADPDAGLVFVDTHLF
uniref:Uncharacterized protein n=1 Tax=Anguilla anguilla TaxID=7936 RepID=A0A0E9T8L8_ANGAN